MIRPTFSAFIVPGLVAAWVPLWTLLALVEGRGFPSGIVLPLGAMATGWTVGWLRTEALREILARTPERWTLSLLGFAPVPVLAAVFFLTTRHLGVFRSDAVSQIEAVLFCAPWVAALAAAHTFQQPRPLAVPAPPAAPVRRPLARCLSIPVGDRVRILQPHTVLWLAAENNYVRVYTADRDYVMRGTLGDVLDQLGSETFVRVHKSYGVNLSAVDAIKPLAKGDAEIALTNGACVRLSRRYRHHLMI